MIAPFIRIQTTSGEIFNEKEVTSFSYKYSEEEDDIAEIRLHSSDVMLCDRPGVQEGERLTLTWGYLDGGPTISRSVYIYDTKAEYGDDGVILTLTCHEKFAMSKMNTAKPQNPSTSESSDPDRIIIESKILQNLFMDGGDKTFLKDVTTSLNPRDKNLIERSINDPAYTNDGKNLYPTETTIYDYDSPHIEARNVGVTRSSQSLNITFYNGNAPTYRSLRSYLDKSPGGPYVIDSRDDGVVIRTRDFLQSPAFDYAYGGEPGHLLTFSPETKNRSKSSTSEKVNAISWDTEEQVAVVNSSENQSKGQTGKKLWEELQEASKDLVGSPAWWQNENLNRTNRPRVVGPALEAAGMKSWDDLATDGHLKDKGDHQYTRDNLGDGRILYSQRVDGQPWGATGSGSGQTGSSQYVPRDGTARVLPHYIRETPQTRATQPGKSIVRGAEPTEQAKAFATNTRENAQLDTNPATATMVGNPTLQSGTIITISNVAKRHSGKYYIKEVTHTFDSGGYITSIGKMVRPGISTKGTEIPSTEPAKDTPNNPIQKWNIPTMRQFMDGVWGEQGIRELDEFDDPWIKKHWGPDIIDQARADEKNKALKATTPDKS